MLLQQKYHESTGDNWYKIFEEIINTYNTDANEKKMEKAALIQHTRSLFSSNICFFQVDNGGAVMKRGLCLGLVIKTPERRH